MMHKNPKTKEEINPNETPILMIHGFSNSSSSWFYHHKRLKEAGHKNLFTINLGDPRLSIEEDYAKKVDEMVQEIKRLTGRNDIVLVGHSMGGLVAIEWRQNYAVGTEVKNIVTLGTPHDGTKMAHLTLGLSKCGKEMLPDSDLIKRQQEVAATDTETEYLRIRSRADHTIIPEHSAYWGSAPKTEIVTLDATGHGGMLFSDTVGDILVSHLAHCLNAKNKEA
jgi:triacylglycerol esterase/lipase EstA (alpha/beta hydrolase family)